MQRIYIVQHPENLVLFYTHTRGDRWSTDIDKAHGFRTEGLALAAIARHLNGKGYVLTRIRPMESGKELRARMRREEQMDAI